MNDTMKLDVRPEVAAFVAEVRARLADLSPDEREELVGGLEADLAERLAEHEGGEPVAEVLGDPASYAAELRAAAGFSPAMAKVRERRQLSVAVSNAIDAAHESWNRLLDAFPSSPRSFLESLQPVWWVARAFVAYMLLVDMLGRRPFYEVLDAAVLSLAVVGSVQLGRGAWGLGDIVRRHVLARLVLIGLNVLAVCLLPAMVGNAKWAVAESLAWQDRWGGDTSEEFRSGLMYDGVELTNVFPYDAQGRPLTGVQLVDADGNPLVINEGLVEEDGSITYPWLSNGSPRFNTFPLPVGPLGEMEERDAGAWHEPNPPRIPPHPISQAPTVTLPTPAPSANE